MKKLALTVTAALAATTLTGAAAVPAIVPAAGEGKIHIKRFVTRDIDSHQTGKNTFAGAAVDRRDGHIIGYDSFTIHTYPKQERANVWDSFALRNGTITALVHAIVGNRVMHGRILNGTGKYQGARGTIAARPAPQNGEKTFITLRYHF